MQPPGVKHLGFHIPLTITQIQGRRMREPGKGNCFRCLRSRPRVYVLGDGRCICEQCLAFDYAEHGHSLGGQHRPPENPVELIHEQSPVSDRFDTAFWERALS